MLLYFGNSCSCIFAILPKPETHEALKPHSYCNNHTMMLVYIYDSTVLWTTCNCWLPLSHFANEEEYNLPQLQDSKTIIIKYINAFF